MPAPTPIDIPADALDKAAPDFYGNLTDEEREAEGLPPREAAPKEEAKPVEAGPPADEPDDEDDEEEGGEDEVEASDATQLILDQIESLRETFSEKTGKAAPETPDEQAQFLKELLEDDDPRVQRMGQMLQKQEQRLERMEAREREQVIAGHLKDIDNEIKFVKQNYTIDGKKVTQAHIEQVENYLKANENAARILSIEEATRRVFPTAEKRVAKPAPNGRPVNKPGTDLGGGQPTATIVDTAASGGAPSGPWKPRPGETMDSALKAAGERLFGIRPT